MTALTPSQRRALDMIKVRGHVTDGCGVHYQTVQALERRGLVALRTEWTRADFSGVSWKPLPLPRREWVACLRLGS